MKKVINIRLEESLLGDLDTYAKELDSTRTCIIEKAINNYLDTLDEMISDERIDDIKSKKNEVYSLGDVFNEVDING
jgi:predicted transcriptional regulator